jgi:hypothetical protein
MPLLLEHLNLASAKLAMVFHYSWSHAHARSPPTPPSFKPPKLRLHACLSLYKPG